MSRRTVESQLDHDTTQLWSHGTNAYLPYGDGESPVTLERRVQRYAKYVAAEFDCDAQRLAAALEQCRADSQHAEGEGKLGWGDAISIGEHALALLQRRGADSPGRARDALSSELEEWQFPTSKPYRQRVWHCHRLPRRLLRRLNLWWLARRRRLNDAVWIEHGPDEPRACECIKIHLADAGGDREHSEVGRMYFEVCHQCRRVLLAKMSVDSDVQGFGLGTRAIMHVIDRTPGYTWYTTLQYDTAESYWQRMARRTGSGFHGPGANGAITCEHMRAADTAGPSAIDA